MTAFWAAVPETTINKDDGAGFRKIDIRIAREPLRM
jgi:hypothetical protein